MLTAPDTTTRIANSEVVTITLDADAAPAKVRLVPRISGELVLDVEENGFKFPAFDAPDLVTVEWLGSDGARLFTSYAEVVSSHYFSIDDLKASVQDEFSDYPEESLYKARQAATETFEENARRSFVHRIGRTKDYRGRPLLALRHNDVYEILTDGYRLVSDCQAEPTAPQALPVWVEYLYGADSVPTQVSRAVLDLAAYYLRPQATPERATGEATEAGFIRYTLAGRDGATGLPEVDATIEQFGRRGAMVL